MVRWEGILRADMVEQHRGKNRADFGEYFRIGARDQIRPYEYGLVVRWEGTLHVLGMVGLERCPLCLLNNHPWRILI
jgi:hypothetical protein